MFTRPLGIAPETGGDYAQSPLACRSAHAVPAPSPALPTARPPPSKGSAIPQRRRKPSRQPSGTTTTDQEAQEPEKSSSAEDFLNGYHVAYALIYDKGDYEGGIAALRSLGYDDNADVATLIGYASRKLGRYDDAKLWYDRALAADPNHVRDLVLLRHVACRAGQPAQGQGRPRKGPRDLRQHRVPRIPRAQSRDRRHQDILGSAHATKRPARQAWIASSRNLSSGRVETSRGPVGSPL